MREFCCQRDPIGDVRHRGGRPFELWGITDGHAGAFREAAAMELAEQTQRLCALAFRAGREEPCPGAECPLWENEECALERLSADGELHDDAWPDDQRQWRQASEGGDPP